ncbi:hypothetical protein LLE49_13270 [Alicyclobacillus tolerans]|nr:hypothetical protein [Alicyclobacillus tolerans]MCF8565689.1 hypothetical protein [Alicyclobacillus tolerans]
MKHMSEEEYLRAVFEKAGVLQKDTERIIKELRGERQSEPLSMEKNSP